MKLDRRALLTGNKKNCHIASMLVQCLPEKLAATAAALEAIDGISVPERDACGKLVVLIEAQGEAQLMECITHIESTRGVISASLVYHQIDN